MYLERLNKMCDFREKITAAGTEEVETQRILKTLENSDGFIAALDEHGKEFSSLELANLISRQKDLGVPVVFVVGGAYGLKDAVLGKAKMKISLGRMTLPHELCKLVFLEQLYRAHTIIAGSGYHH